MNDKNMVQCLLCAHISLDGIKRLKDHLIGGCSDVVKCPKTTSTIKEEITRWKNRGIKRKSETCRIVEAQNEDVDIILPSVNKKIVPSVSSCSSIGKKVNLLA